MSALIPRTDLWAQSDLHSQARVMVGNVCKDRATPVAVAQQTGVTLATQSDISAGDKEGWEAVFKIDRVSVVRVRRLATFGRLLNATLEWRKDNEPRLLLNVSGDCVVRTARRMVLDRSGHPTAIVHLDEELNDTNKIDQLNPPVPEGPGTVGIRVALVDSGVNYTLTQMAERLARDEQGRILGFDFWDQDHRPFDAHPARSPYFPQRHGTRTASLLLREAPDVMLVPYRYPRPDMTRMAQLLQEVERHEIRIVGLPLGGRKRSEWQAFERVARRMNETLFIASAGNSGQNIDSMPVYPARLDLNNMIVVTSADDSGQPAAGSNWGRKSVDLLVPAENRSVLGFDGNEVTVSGSSYAVSRVAALGSRILSRQRGLDATELKAKILGRAIKGGFEQFVSAGYLPDPLANGAEVELISTRAIEAEAGRQHPLVLDVHIALLVDSGWQQSEVPRLIQKLGGILDQCQIGLSQVQQYTFRVSTRLLDFDAATSHTLATQTNLPAPTVYLVRDTLRNPAYAGEAFGIANSQYRTWLRDTIWLTAGIRDAEVALAHEIFHLLTDTGTHSTQAGNLMQAQTLPGDIRLSEEQCQEARETALKKGLVRRTS